MSTEQFTRLNNDINKRIFELCSSADDKLGGVMAIEALIDLNAEENTKLTRFANYLRLVLPTNDVPTMIAAAKALGTNFPPATLNFTVLIICRTTRNTGRDTDL